MPSETQTDYSDMKASEAARRLNDPTPRGWIESIFPNASHPEARERRSEISRGMKKLANRALIAAGVGIAGLGVADHTLPPSEVGSVTIQQDYGEGYYSVVERGKDELEQQTGINFDRATNEDATAHLKEQTGDGGHPGTNIEVTGSESRIFKFPSVDAEIADGQKDSN